MVQQDFMKGRGAQLNTHNPYHKLSYSADHVEALDIEEYEEVPTQLMWESPKKIVNKVNSPDVPFSWSMNPYQGCEHGCVYCYARNAHQYWGLSAGLDFERKIIAKRNAAELLEAQLRHPAWRGEPIMFSGNTDCYQPLERKLGITRKMLEVALRYKQPLGMITKNALILRDLPILKEMAQEGLVQVAVSVTTFDEDLRRSLEPRTSTGLGRIRAIQALSEAGIPTSVMVAPIIPGLTSHEIPEIIRRAAEAGAKGSAYTLVRLNGAVGPLFQNWIEKAYPDKARKVLNHIRAIHGGNLNENRFGKRMRGEGNIANAINKLYHAARKKYMGDRELPPFNREAFLSLGKGGQMSLF